MPVWRYEAGAFTWRSGCSCPTGRTRSTSPTGCSRGKRNPAARAAPRRALPAPRRAGQRRRAPRDTCSPWPKTSTRFTGGGKLPPLRFLIDGRAGAFTFDRKETSTILYWTEKNRGYESQGTLWSPGYFRVDSERRASRPRWSPPPKPGRRMRALAPEEALDAERERRTHAARPPPDRRRRLGAGAELVLAADQFIITPAGRVEDAARAHATATRSAPSSPATTGSPTGAATP